MQKIFAIFFSFFFLFALGTHAVSAQSEVYPSPTPYSTNSRVNPDVEKNSATYTQTVLIEMMSALACQLAGFDPVNPQGRCLGIDPVTKKIGYVENNAGAVGFMANMIGATFNIPIHSDDYPQVVASNFGIVKNTYAQSGYGFKSLSPLMPIWTAFRNMVYIIFVIIFMLIGLGIMLRRNIDARAVMTVQNSIPKAVVILLLVTFSFAIAGFLIDVMYLAMYVFYEIFSTIPGVSFPDLNPTNLQGANPLNAVGGLGGIAGIALNASLSVADVVTSIMDNKFGQTLGTAIAGIVLIPVIFFAGPGGWVAAIAGGLGIGGGLGLGGSFLGGGIGDDVLGFVGGLIAFFIILIAILFALFRLWFLLLKSYVFILVDVALAPLWIAGSLIPGSPLTAGSWFRHLMSYISVFPATLLMFLLGSSLMQQFSHGIPDPQTMSGFGQALAAGSSSSIPYFTPPFIGNSINPKVFSSLIGMAIILMTPEVLNIVKDTFKAPPPLKYQQAITGALGFGAGGINKVAHPIKEAAWHRTKDGAMGGFLGHRALDYVQNKDRERAREGRAPGRIGRALTTFLGAREGPEHQQTQQQRRKNELEAQIRQKYTTITDDQFDRELEIQQHLDEQRKTHPNRRQFDQERHHIDTRSRTAILAEIQKLETERRRNNLPVPPKSVLEIQARTNVTGHLDVDPTLVPTIYP